MPERLYYNANQVSDAVGLWFGEWDDVHQDPPQGIRIGPNKTSPTNLSGSGINGPMTAGFRTFQTDPLPSDGIIGGTLKFVGQIPASQNSGETAHVRMHISVVRPDKTVRGVLLNNHTTDVLCITSSFTGPPIGDEDGIPLNSVMAFEGDCVFIEHGTEWSATSSSRSQGVRVGGTGEDLFLGGPTGGGRCGWYEFSDWLVEESGQELFAEAAPVVFDLGAPLASASKGAGASATAFAPNLGLLGSPRRDAQGSSEVNGVVDTHADTALSTSAAASAAALEAGTSAAGASDRQTGASVAQMDADAHADASRSAYTGSQGAPLSVDLTAFGVRLADGTAAAELSLSLDTTTRVDASATSSVDLGVDTSAASTKAAPGAPAALAGAAEVDASTTRSATTAAEGVDAHAQTSAASTKGVSSPAEGVDAAAEVDVHAVRGASALAGVDLEASTTAEGTSQLWATSGAQMDAHTLSQASRSAHTSSEGAPLSVDLGAFVDVPERAQAAPLGMAVDVAPESESDKFAATESTLSDVHTGPVVTTLDTDVEAVSVDLSAAQDVTGLVDRPAHTGGVDLAADVDAEVTSGRSGQVDPLGLAVSTQTTTDEDAQTEPVAGHVDVSVHDRADYVVGAAPLGMGVQATPLAGRSTTTTTSVFVDLVVGPVGAETFSERLLLPVSVTVIPSLRTRTSLGIAFITHIPAPDLVTVVDMDTRTELPQMHTGTDIPDPGEGYLTHIPDPSTATNVEG